MTTPDPYPARGEPHATYVVTDRPEEWPGYRVVGGRRCCFHNLDGMPDASFLMKQMSDNEEVKP